MGAHSRRLLFRVKQDSKIRPDAFDGRFTAEKFAGFFFTDRIRDVA